MIFYFSDLMENKAIGIKLKKVPPRTISLLNNLNLKRTVKNLL